MSPDYNDSDTRDAAFEVLMRRRELASMLITVMVGVPLGLWGQYVDHEMHCAGLILVIGGAVAGGFIAILLRASEFVAMEHGIDPQRIDVAALERAESAAHKKCP